MAQGKIKSVKSTLFFFYVGELTMKLLKAVKPLFKGGNFIKKNVTHLTFWISEFLHYNAAEILKEWFITQTNANYIDEVRSL